MSLHMEVDVIDDDSSVIPYYQADDIENTKTDDIPIVAGSVKREPNDVNETIVITQSNVEDNVTVGQNDVVTYVVHDNVEIMSKTNNIPIISGGNYEAVEGNDSQLVIKLICNICHKRFDSDQAYREHVASHMIIEEGIEVEEQQVEAGEIITEMDPDLDESQMLYRCGVCNKPFTQPGNVKIHMRVHDKVRPYPCPTCGKSFTQLGNLQTHLHIHRDSKPYVCDICLRGFTQAGNVKKHRETVHAGKDPLICHVCRETFTSSTKLSIHAAEHTLDGAAPPPPTRRSRIMRVTPPTAESPERLESHDEQSDSVVQSSPVHPPRRSNEDIGTLPDINNKTNQIIVTQTTDNKRKILVPKDFDLSSCRRIRMEVYYCTLCKLSFRSDAELTSHLDTHTNDPVEFDY